MNVNENECKKGKREREREREREKVRKREREGKRERERGYYNNLVNSYSTSLRILDKEGSNASDILKASTRLQ